MQKVNWKAVNELILTTNTGRKKNKVEKFAKVDYNWWKSMENTLPLSSTTSRWIKLKQNIFHIYFTYFSNKEKNGKEEMLNFV